MNLVKKYWKNIFIILIFVLFAYTLIFDGDFSVILETVQSARWSIVGICACIALSYYILDGLNLTLFTRIYYPDYSLRSGLVIALISPFFNGITPFASGGQVAQVYVYGRQGVDTTTSIGIMLMHFIMYQAVLVVYSAVVLIFQYQYFSEHFIELFYVGILGFCISAGVIGALVLGSISKRFQEFVINFVFKVAYKFHLIKDYDQKVIEYTNQLDDFRKEIRLLFSNKKVVIITLLVNVLRLSIIYSVPYFAFKALGYSVAGIAIQNIIMMSSFITMVTAFIPIPGASGGSEGMFTLMFGLLFGQEASSCAMLIWRFVTYYLMMFVGLIVFIYHEKLFEKKKLKKIEI